MGGRGGGDGRREERKAREASLLGQRGGGPLREGAQGPQTALLASVGPGASRTGSGLPPAGVLGEEGARPPPNLQPPAGTPRPDSLPTAPRKPSGSPLLHWSERRSSDPPAADLWLTPSPLGRFLPPGPVCTEHPGPREEPGSRLVPASPSETGPLRPKACFPTTRCPGHTRWALGGGARGRGGVPRPQCLCWEKGIPLDEAKAAHHGPGRSQRLPPASCCWTSAPGARPHPCPSPRLCPVARPSPSAPPGSSLHSTCSWSFISSRGPGRPSPVHSQLLRPTVSPPSAPH